MRVVYPAQGSRITAFDSTFLFGNVGNGRATLTVNGAPVDVAPNGAFLAWVAIPITADSAPLFRFLSRLGGDSAVRDLRVSLPRLVVNPDSGLWIDRGSISPSGAMWLEEGELVRVSLTASPGAAVALHLPGGEVVPLVPSVSVREADAPFNVEAPAAATEMRYVGVFTARRIGPMLEAPATLSAPGAEWDSVSGARIVVASERGTLRVPMPVRIAVHQPAGRQVVELDDDTARAGNTDGAVSGSPVPDGTYHWFFPNGTRAAISGRVGRFLRLQLSAGAVAWTDISNVAAALPAGTPAPRTALRLIRLFPQRAMVTARLALGSRVPVRVDEDGNRLIVRLYSCMADMNFVQYGGTDPGVPLVAWSQPVADECEVTFTLAAPVFGYRVRWDGADLLLDIRRAPAINRANPLAGRIIAIDPGHPPGGSTGPTGLREAEANLAVSRALRRLLERAGARVVLARDADTAVGLYERIHVAEAAGAELLVSIHNNAFPDGVNPWRNNGTSTYYFHPRSVRLAMLVQQGMVRRMGLRDLGVGRGDLALVRGTWMPSVLTEGAFLMIPQQENALRTPAFQEAYARGVMDGIAAWLREFGR